jgi:hypothetical protein
MIVSRLAPDQKGDYRDGAKKIIVIKLTSKPQPL